MTSVAIARAVATELDFSGIAAACSLVR